MRDHRGPRGVAELPDDWGFPGPAVLESLIEVNRRCEARDPEPARKRDATPLTQPPFYVTEVVPAITMTFAGLLIDPDARVLDEQRNLRRRLPPRPLRRRPQSIRSPSGCAPRAPHSAGQD